jgi:hypothetical protein
MAAEKDSVTNNLRLAVLAGADFLIETDRADIMLITLSFRSRVRPERHVWIDTGYSIIAGTQSSRGMRRRPAGPRIGNSIDGYSIDLEDWTYGGTWDNAVATVFTEFEPVARDVSRSWLRGDSLDTALERGAGSTIKRFR